MPKKKLSKTGKKVEPKLLVNIYNQGGKVVGKLVLPAEIFDAKVNPSLLAQSVRVYLANQRLGTHSSKTRSEVAGSTRKIYRQKGTGRARHGDIKAPIFIGGGVAFGPKPREYRLNLSRKMKRQALFASLTDKFKKGQIKIIKELEEVPAKTKVMVKILINLQLLDKRPKKGSKILLVLANSIKNILLAGRNLGYLKIDQAGQLNAYTVLNHQNVLFTQNAVSALADHFLKEKKETDTLPRQIKVGTVVRKNEIKVKRLTLKRTSRLKGAKSSKRKRIVRKEI